MATALEQINRSLRLIGVLAEEETATASMSQDALTALNQMLDSWSTERLAVYATTTQVVIWPANIRSATLGPTGSLALVAGGTAFRPIRVENSSYIFVPSQNLAFPLQFLNEQQYNAIAVKTNTSTYPLTAWVNNTYPDTTIYVYPVPTVLTHVHFVSVQPLTQPATLATELAFPPGYLRAFTYNLACEIAPEFGVEPSPQVQRIAMTSKRNLKRINNPNDLLAMPYPLVARRWRFNIFTGMPT